MCVWIRFGLHFMVQIIQVIDQTTHAIYKFLFEYVLWAKCNIYAEIICFIAHIHIFVYSVFYIYLYIHADTKIFSLSNRKRQVVKFLAHHVAVEMEDIFCQLTMVFYSCKIRMQTRRRDQLIFYRFKCGRCCMITVPVKNVFWRLPTKSFSCSIKIEPYSVYK